MDDNDDLLPKSEQDNQSWLDDSSCFLLDSDNLERIGVENMGLMLLDDIFASMTDCDLSQTDSFHTNTEISDTSKAELGGTKTLVDLLNAPLVAPPPDLQPIQHLDDSNIVTVYQVQNRINIPPPGSPQEIKPRINDVNIVKTPLPQRTLQCTMPSSTNAVLQNSHITNLQQQVTNGQVVENMVTDVQGVTLVNLLQQYPQLRSQLQLQNQPQPILQELLNTQQATSPATFQQVVVPVINTTASNYVNGTSAKPIAQLSNICDTGDSILNALPFADVLERSLIRCDDDKPQKRCSSHNVIEKRYRCSINDKIAQLREMLMSKDSKSNKAAVLKKAIDYINFLTNANKRLKMENAFLRKHLTLNDKVTVRDLIKKDICLSDIQDVNSDVGSPYAIPNLCSYPTPPHSDPDSPNSNAAPDSPQSMDELLTGEDVQTLNMRNSALARGGQAAFCLFMVAFLAFNPIGTAFQSIGSYSSSSDSLSHVGRKILESDTSSYEIGWLGWSLAWLVNCLITIFLLIKVFVYGEPSLQPFSEQSAKFWRQRKQADSDMEKGEYSSAAKHLRQCLVILRRPLAASKFDNFCSLSWNLMHLMLNQIKISNLFTRKPNESERAGKKAVRESAEIYHKLNQLQLTGNSTDSNMSSLIFALSAVNLSEMVDGEFLADDLRAEIYACAALRFKHSGCSALSFMVHFLLSRARNIVKQSDLESVTRLQWICHPLAHRFLIDEDMSYMKDVEIFTIGCKANVVEVIGKQFGQKMLKKAYFSLVISHDSDITNTDDSVSTKKSQSSQALEYIQIARDSSLCGTSDDVVGDWWCNIASAAANWHLGNDVTALSFSSRVDELKNTGNPLTSTIFAAFCARRDYIALENLVGRSRLMSEATAVIKKCNIASQLLNESLIFTQAKKDTLEAAFQLVSCDWLLNTRTGVWQDVYCTEESTNRAPVEYISAFEQDLNFLRRLAQPLKAVVPQIYLHEATERLMAGACPTRTQQLLRRTIRRRHRSKGESNKNSLHDPGPRERAAALMLACRHLPHPLLSAPGQRADMLHKAVTTFEKLGDKRSVKDCQKMLIRLGSAGSGTVST